MLGQILVAQGALSREGLGQALAEQGRRVACGEPVRLGELLVEMGLVTATQLSRARAERETAKSR